MILMDAGVMKSAGFDHICGHDNCCRGWLRGYEALKMSVRMRLYDCKFLQRKTYKHLEVTILQTHIFQLHFGSRSMIYP